jgi:hypothetical protein
MNKIDNISIYYKYYLNWKQLYNNYIASDIKAQSFFEEIWA